MPTPSLASPFRRVRRPFDARIPRQEVAQGLAEYAVILALVALVVLVILTVYGSQVANLFSRVTNAVAAY